MTLLAAVLGVARAGDAIENLPAQLVSVDTWEARTAAVASLVGRTTDPGDLARVEAASQVVRLLAENEPGATRARIRALVAGAVDRRPAVRSEATKAAAVGAELPEMPSHDAWYPKVPHPSPPDAVALHLATPDLAEWGGSAGAVEARVAELAKAVDWPLAEASPLDLHAELAGVYGARWADRVGYAADVRWQVTRDGAPVFDVLTRAFQAGPLRRDSAEVLVGTAFYELLAQDGLLAVVTGGEGTAVPDPEIQTVELHQLCVYRTIHPDARLLTLDVGGLVFPVGVATFGCLELPEGTRIGSSSSSMVVGADLLLRVDDSVTPGQTVMTVADPAAFEKLKAKRRITEVQLIPAG